MFCKSLSSKIRIGVPSGEVLAKILPLRVQTLNNSPSLPFLFALVTLYFLNWVRFSFMKIRSDATQVAAAEPQGRFGIP